MKKPNIVPSKDLNNTESFLEIRHLLMDEDLPKGQFFCPTCNKKELRKESLMMHLKIEHELTEASVRIATLALQKIMRNGELK